MGPLSCLASICLVGTLELEGPYYDRCVSLCVESNIEPLEYKFFCWSVLGVGRTTYGISIHRLYINICSISIIFTRRKELYSICIYIYIKYTREILVCEHFIFEIQYIIQRFRFSLRSHVLIPRPCLSGIHGQGAKTHAVIPMARQT